MEGMNRRRPTVRSVLALDELHVVRVELGETAMIDRSFDGARQLIETALKGLANDERSIAFGTVEALRFIAGQRALLRIRSVQLDAMRLAV